MLQKEGAAALCRIPAAAAAGLSTRPFAPAPSPVARVGRRHRLRLRTSLRPVIGQQPLLRATWAEQATQAQRRASGALHSIPDAVLKGRVVSALRGWRAGPQAGPRFPTAAATWWLRQLPLQAAKAPGRLAQGEVPWAQQRRSARAAAATAAPTMLLAIPQSASVRPLRVARGGWLSRGLVRRYHLGVQLAAAAEVAMGTATSNPRQLNWWLPRRVQAQIAWVQLTSSNQEGLPAAAT